MEKIASEMKIKFRVRLHLSCILQKIVRCKNVKVLLFGNTVVGAINTEVKGDIRLKVAAAMRVVLLTIRIVSLNPFSLE